MKLDDAWSRCPADVARFILAESADQVDADVLVLTALVESDFDRNAFGDAGRSLGLFQFYDVNIDAYRPDGAPEEWRNNAQYSARAAAKYLQSCWASVGGRPKTVRDQYIAARFGWRFGPGRAGSRLADGDSYPPAHWLEVQVWEALPVSTSPVSAAAVAAACVGGYAVGGAAGALLGGVIGMSSTRMSADRYSMGRVGDR